MAWIEGGGSLIRRPDAISLDYLTGFAVGPREVSDPSEGLLNRVWRVHVLGSQVWLSKADDANEDWEPETLVFEYSGAPIVEVDLAFDQNGAVTICAERYTGAGATSEVWLYWLDSRVGDYVFSMVCPGRTPRILLDDPQFVEESDLLLFYVSDQNNRIEFRRQRDFYLTVFETTVEGTTGLFLEEVALATDRRLHVIYGRRDHELGRYVIETLESAPYPAHLDDSIEPASHIVSFDTITTTLVYNDQDSISSSTQLLALDLVDLLLVVDLVGPLYFSEVEATSGSGRMISLTRVDLTIAHTAFERESIQGLGRLQSLTLTTYVIAASTNQDLVSTSGTGRIQSLTIT